MTKARTGRRPTTPRAALRGTANHSDGNDTERSFRSRRCHLCGDGTIARRDMRGVSLPHRDVPAVVLTESPKIPYCNQCGEMLLDAADAGALDAAVERDYRRQRQATLLDDLQAILESHQLRQCDIEVLFGVSSGYVSKLLRDEKAASPLLLRLVHLLRVAPQATVASIGEVAVLPPSARKLLGSSVRSA